MTIEDKEARIEELLRAEFPGFQVHAKTREKGGRTGNTSTGEWSSSREIVISFDPEPTQIGPDPDFRPVEIRGEPLSATILRERR
jgi:hypothetical protein